MKRVDTLSQLKAELKNVNSVVSQDTAFVAKAVLYLAEILEEMSEATHKKKSRNLSDWQVFMGEKMRMGLSVQQAAKEWKKVT